MRLRARLTRLEELHAAASIDIRSLTDEQLVERMRDGAALIGLDWNAFKNDPAATIRDFFDGHEDEDGLIDELLGAIQRAGIRTLLFFLLSVQWIRLVLLGLVMML